MKKFKIVALVSLLAIAGVAVAQQLCSPAAKRPLLFLWFSGSLRPRRSRLLRLHLKAMLRSRLTESLLT